jgi:pimeloyl-ACP methyl ester carboxylesterase
MLALSGCSLALTGQRMLGRQVQRADFVETTLPLPGGAYHYWDNGVPGDTRPVVLLLHGFGGDGLGTWSPVMRALSKDYRVLVPDLLWFGASAQTGSPQLEAQVLAVEGLLDHTGVAQATVVGLSYGGFVALGLKLQAPQRLERLVIVDSPGPFFGEEEEATMLQHFGATAVEEIFLPQGPEDVQRLLNLAWYHPPQLPRFLLKDLYIHSFSQQLEEQGALLNDLRSRRGSMTLEPAPLPVLVIWGEHDAVFPMALGQQLATSLGGELRVIPDTAHGPNIERPKEFVAVLRAWMEAPATGSPTSGRP